MVPLSGVPLGALKGLKLLRNLRDTKGSHSRKDNISLHDALLSCSQVHIVENPFLAILMPLDMGDLCPETDLLIQVVFFGDATLVCPDLRLRCITVGPVVVGLE